ncbi:hypothetical protein J2Z21_009587 [Streptomyces griseochromogenes]|uniref:Uncharacterized protein n=1 Tax=Streptomyces griseochromogenes TaxID=68214 RepID=A0ABS4MA70_9ACTN|nr:hypothetical protein [Streptomyces griseochromogenes]MBP2056568.1 hypothetical protein [Streptomyces griseochromogenes]
MPHNAPCGNRSRPHPVPPEIWNIEQDRKEMPPEVANICCRFRKQSHHGQVRRHPSKARRQSSSHNGSGGASTFGD